MGIPYAEVIGDPIAHSKSPLIHKFWLEKLGIEAEYRATLVTAARLSTYFEERRSDSCWRGCNITMPHKIAALKLVDECDESAKEAQAVNCVVSLNGKLRGMNTDGSGFMEALPGIDTNTWCVIGAGGAARAALGVLELLTVMRANLIVRDAAKGRAALAAAFMEGDVFDFSESDEAMSGCVAAINASPLGMVGERPMPEPVLNSLQYLRRGAFVLDMVYAPLETELLKRAKALSFKTIDGLAMLIGQARHSFFQFYGVEAPRARDAKLRNLLT